jgi:hypothetical protein
VADFTVIASGVSVVDWLDPSFGGTPSRLNSRPGYPQKRYLGLLGVPVVLKAVVDGVVAPPDASLGGRLFTAFVVDAPVLPFVGIVSPYGQSAVQVVTATVPGHYTIGFRRPNGGLEHVHLDIG